MDLFFFYPGSDTDVSTSTIFPAVFFYCPQQLAEKRIDCCTLLFRLVVAVVFVVLVLVVFVFFVKRNLTSHPWR